MAGFELRFESGPMTRMRWSAVPPVLPEEVKVDGPDGSRTRDLMNAMYEHSARELWVSMGPPMNRRACVKEM